MNSNPSVVFPLPAGPSTTMTFPRGMPPFKMLSRPVTPVLTRSASAIGLPRSRVGDSPPDGGIVRLFDVLGGFGCRGTRLAKGLYQIVTALPSRCDLQQRRQPAAMRRLEHVHASRVSGVLRS